MKSSVASRKQRFWALLLAVVMVVGLLPTAGVKATKPENSQSFVLCDDEQKCTIGDNDIVYADDIITNGNSLRTLEPGEEFYNIDDDTNGLVSVYYRDIDSSTDLELIHASGAVYDSGDVFVYDGKYTVVSYDSVFGDKGKIAVGNRSDRWMVSNVSLSTNGATSVILEALPKYTIDWDTDGNLWDADCDAPDAWPTSFTEGDEAIDLEDYIPEIEGYTFEGWLVAVNADGFGTLANSNKLKNTEINKDPDLYNDMQQPLWLIDVAAIDKKINDANCFIIGQDECTDVLHYYNIYLIAQWSSNTYDVTFDTAIPEGEDPGEITGIPSVTGVPYHQSDEGEFLYYTDDDDVDEDLVETPKYGTVYMPAPLPGLKHYGFGDEWYVTNTAEDIEEALVGKVYLSNQSVSIAELAAQTGYADTIEMAPVWYPKDYTVKFDYQANSLTPPVDLANPQAQTKPYTAEEDSEVNSIVSIKDKMKPDGGRYTFKGWSVVKEVTANTTIFTEDTDMKTLVDAAEEAGVVFTSSNDKVDLKDTFTLYGIWEEIPETVTVKFDLQTVNENAKIDDRTVDYGSPVNKPTPDPVEKGYTFDGWYTASTCSDREVWDFDDPVYQDRTLYAKWIPVSYTLTFLGPNQPADQVEAKPIDDIADLRLYEEGGYKGFNATSSAFYSVTFPDVPVKNDVNGTAYDEHFVFLGWSVGDSGIIHSAKSEVSMKDIITEFGSDDATIPVRANWYIPEYDIYFVNENKAVECGMPTPAPDNPYNGIVDIPDLVYDGEDYRFNGWAIFGATPQISSGEENVRDIVQLAETEPGYIEYEDGDEPTNGKITLHALWEPWYKVIYNANSDQGDQEPRYYLYDSKDNIIVASNTNEDELDIFTKEGYTFANWNTKKDGSGDSYKPDDVLNPEKAFVSGAVTCDLYAQWTPNEYTVKFDKNAADATGKMADQPFTYGVEAALSAIGFTRNGYTFAGWATSVDGEVVVEYADKEPVENLTTVNNGSVTLYAVWEPVPEKLYDVIFEPLNENYSVIPVKNYIVTWEEKNVTYSGSPMALEDEDHKYHFKGWALDPEAEAADFEADKDTSVESIVAAAGDVMELADDGHYVITLYPIWEKCYSVSFHHGYQKDIDFESEEIEFEAPFKMLPRVLYEDNEDLKFAFDKDELYQLKGYKLVSLDVVTDVEYGETGLLVNCKREADYPKFTYDDLVNKNIPIGVVEEYAAEFADENKVLHVAAFWEPKGKKSYTWLNGNGNPLYEIEVDEDAEAPKLPDGKIPTKTDEEYDYTFTEWEETEDENGVVYTPKFNRNKKKYTVTFVDEDGTTVLKAATEYEYGTKAADIAKPANPTKAGYTFEKWSPEIADVKGNATYKATYKLNSNPGGNGGNGGNEDPVKYIITWIDGNGNEIYNEEVAEGETPKYDAAKHGTPEKQAAGFATYTFNDKWEPAIHAVTGDQEYVAQFDTIGPENGQEGQGGNNNNPPVINPPAITYYTITWANYNGAGATTTTQVAAGDRPSYNGTPAKAEDAENTYTFIGWTPNITVATGNATYTAQFTATKKDNNNNPTPTETPKPTSGPIKSREYKINYFEQLDDESLVQLKKTLNPDTYVYGVGAEIKYGIDKEGYKFLGWYSQKTGRRVTKISQNSKGDKNLIAKFVPDDDGTGNGSGNGSGNPASEFGILFVRLVDYATNSMTLKWVPIDGVDGYDIFGSRCNSKDIIRPYEPIASVPANVSEYVMKGLLAKTYYKFYIRAYILVNNEKRYITTSLNVHGVTLNDTYGVADEINIDKIVLKYINGKSKTKFDSTKGSKSEDIINITMKVGQSLVVVSSEKSDVGKEIRAHRPISFESSNPNVCKVGRKKNHKYGKEVSGKANTYKSYAITAVAAGECDIIVFAQNGIYKTIHVTVK